MGMFLFVYWLGLPGSHRFASIVSENTNSKFNVKHEKLMKDIVTSSFIVALESIKVSTDIMLINMHETVRFSAEVHRHALQKACTR